MTRAPVFGYMNYNPNFETVDTCSATSTPYAISPLDIQILYQKLFDIYCGAFIDKQGDFLSLLRLFSGDYRRAVMAIETSILEKETEKMAEIFKPNT